MRPFFGGGGAPGSQGGSEGIPSSRSNLMQVWRSQDSKRVSSSRTGHESREKGQPKDSIPGSLSGVSNEEEK